MGLGGLLDPSTSTSNIYQVRDFDLESMYSTRAHQSNTDAGYQQWTQPLGSPTSEIHPRSLGASTAAASVHRGLQTRPTRRQSPTTSRSLHPLSPNPTSIHQREI